MALPTDYSNGKYLKKFAALGPYLREKQCLEGSYFFDSLAVCVNTNIAPEKREFWGWWMILSPSEEGFEYSYHLGLYNSHGSWQAKPLKDHAVTDFIEQNLLSFHQSLSKQFSELELTLFPSAQMAEFKLELSA
ncbi:sigma factor-binding protein Crl [Providencia stuartii]|uniref:Sigma factor-binding protein Crl n=3 Tax=Enterobacterales TaxID=91347 RepID=A0A1S1HT59_PROST|nr:MULTISPECIES: sigma factor-binding protein Crl [Providencia]MDV5227930.1 sigma factor-binding protein Crl [Providencia rettgeri]QQO63303.1 sigma factor-binding protein Crl [Providencia manganoxydans]ELR5114781.1 sigma factor-binding protein Crl [Providencia stuartii]ELR5115278.1 sigma factor-binding protein Crl [Providencia stuartii]ELR5300266.1 sigma factor-binding protein Crl [Providencia stuartii]